MTRRLNAVPDSPKRAALYVRVSDIGTREADSFHSPDLQLDAMRRYAAASGLVETAVFEDIDATGRNFARAGIQAAIAAARAGQFDALVVLDLSRMGRNTAETLRVIKELQGIGVAVVSTVERIDDSPEGQFMLGQFLGMAQLYSDQMGRRWRSVHEHMVKDGRQVGQPPIGYVQADTGRVTATGRNVMAGPPTVDPAMGPAVARAFVDYAAGVKVRDIARRLGDLRGRPVWPAQVRAMMRRRFYVGYVTYKGVEELGRHQPLVDERTWAACQRRVARDATTPSRRLEVAHSLSGIAVCDACDAKATLRSSRDHGPMGQRIVRLGCPRQSDLKTCAGCGSMRVDLVEAEVLVQLEDLLARLKVDGPEQLSLRARQSQGRSDAVRLRAELRATRAARSRLAVAWAHRRMDESAYRDADGDLAEVADGLRRALDEAESVAAVSPRRATAAVKRLLSLWPDASVPERHRMLRDCRVEVRLRSGVGWREPVAGRVEVVELRACL